MSLDIVVSTVLMSVLYSQVKRITFSLYYFEMFCLNKTINIA